MKKPGFTGCEKCVVSQQWEKASWKCPFLGVKDSRYGCTYEGEINRKRTSEYIGSDFLCTLFTWFLVLFVVSTPLAGMIFYTLIREM